VLHHAPCRCAALGFRPDGLGLGLEYTFDDIIRIHIEDDLGGALPSIRSLLNAPLATLERDFAAVYAPIGRPSISGSS